MTVRDPTFLPVLELELLAKANLFKKYPEIFDQSEHGRHRRYPLAGKLFKDFLDMVSAYLSLQNKGEPILDLEPVTHDWCQVVRDLIFLFFKPDCNDKAL